MSSEQNRKDIKLFSGQGISIEPKTKLGKAMLGVVGLLCFACMISFLYFMQKDMRYSCISLGIIFIVCGSMAVSSIK